MFTALRLRGGSGWRIALTAVVVMFALVALVGCSSDDDSASPTTEASAIAENTATPMASPVATTAAAAVTINNCGYELVIAAPPQRAVSMNQAATEILLALGLQDRMIGTAYLDDAILPAYADAYAAVPVLSDEYPTREVLLGEEPDFVYGSYSSAFGDEAAGSRESLEELGIGSYVSGAACADRTLRPEKVTFETVFAEIMDIARIFGVEAEGEALVAQLEADLAEATDDASMADGMTIAWYDGGTEAPTMGVCCGAPGMIIEALGGENAFGGVAGSWGDVSWEEFVASDADFIVLVDASWDLAADKQAFLESDPATGTMTAVQEALYGTVPFSASTPGVRNVTAVVELATAIRAARGE